MSSDIIVTTVRLGAPPWPTLDPFLFCVNHDDAYPRGNADLGPDAPLTGRRIGMDFEGKDGWRMYHGDVVPGFPRHPHRGFETVTIGKAGYVDHCDSLGATARFGAGDVQWMTAGGGIVHSEMFPLVKSDAPNPTGLFQIWLNLPAADKMVEPHFTMLWRHTIPTVLVQDARGRSSTVRIIAGTWDEHVAPAPPPHSWASRPESSVAIWTMEIDPGAELTLPSVGPDVVRTLYVVQGGAIRIADQTVQPGHAAQLREQTEVPIAGAETKTELLLLQGRPIAEPVAAHGPFVMNTREQIEQAIADYRRTEYGGWPWKSDGPVHPRDAGRFAIHAGGRKEHPDEPDREPAAQ